MNPVEQYTASGHSNSLDDKEERLCQRKELDRDQRAAETDEQRGECCAGADSETGLNVLPYAVYRERYCTTAQECTLAGETGK